MDKRTLYVIWSMLFALCALLGFIPEPGGFLRVLLTLLSMGFFVPPALLLWKGSKSEAALIQNLSVTSLALSLALILVNFLSVALSETLGTVLYAVLVIVSTPMICSGYWVLSLFCWAFLMVWARKKLK